MKDTAIEVFSQLSPPTRRRPCRCLKELGMPSPFLKLTWDFHLSPQGKVKARKTILRATPSREEEGGRRRRARHHGLGDGGQPARPPQALYVFALSELGRRAAPKLAALSRKGGGLVDAPGRWLVGAKGEPPL
jgi:hypothetical protein